jgi:hypothetical protein
MKILITFLISFCIITAKAQTITHSHFLLSDAADSFRSIELEINSKYVIVISGTGDILYMETLDGDELFEGDCVSLGFPIKFYDTYDIHDISGRIKSIGNIKIAYNNTFDIHDIKGTLKFIGDVKINYYNTVDIHDPKGKVKSVGNVSVKYYNVFDPGRVFGQIKSITGNSDQLTVRSRPNRYEISGY